MKPNVLLCTLLLSLLSSRAQSASTTDSIASTVGFFVGYGTEHHEVLKVQYDYHLIFLQVHYAHPVYSGTTWQCEAFVLPQYNICFFKPQTNQQQEQWGYEVGVSAGVRFRKTLFQNGLDAYAGGGTGPLYISRAPARQASGVIFSSSVIAGMVIPLHRSLSADIRVGFRHISNAGFIQPNGGINIIYGCVGICRTL